MDNATCARSLPSLALLMLVAFSAPLLGGCAAIKAEKTRPGGIVGKFSDDVLVEAPSKRLRVLRATAIMGALAHIGTSTVQGKDQILAFTLQTRSTAYDLGMLLAVAESQLADYDPTFDLHMKRVDDNLFRMAGLTLERKALKELINDVEDGQFSFFSLMGALMELVDSARWGFAGYRDLRDSFAAVYCIDKLREGNATKAAESKLCQTFKSGDGRFTAYNEFLSSVYSSNDDMPKPNDAALIPWISAFRLGCERSGWKTLVEKDSVTINGGMCKIVENNFRLGRNALKKHRALDIKGFDEIPTDSKTDAKSAAAGS